MKTPAAVCAGLLLAASAWGFPLPPPLETTHLLGRGLAAGPPPLPLTDEFYALGWSRDNAFAFLERRSVGGGRELRLRVVDLVEDRVLFQQEWPDWGEEGARDGWWEAKAPVVADLFARFGLVPTSWQLGVFPLILDNEFYTLALRTVPSARDSAWIERLEILVHSTGRGLKTVKDASGYWRWAALLGFLPSPFENRLALVLLVQPAGWDGDLQPLRFFVTGLSLKAGFPKP